MKTILCLLMFCASLGAQSLSIVVYDPTGKTPDTPLSSSAYSFPDTPANSSSSVVLHISNPSPGPVEIGHITIDNPNFTVTGDSPTKVLSPNSSNFEEFTVNFTPAAAGAFSGILQAPYYIQQNGCSLTASPTSCPFANIKQNLQGNALAPVLVVSYSGPNGSGVLPPNTPNSLDFGNSSTSATSTVKFTLSNRTPAPISTPAIKLLAEVYVGSAFTSTASALPALIPANASVDFSVIFAPGQTGRTTAILTIGQNLYPLAGTGVAGADTIDSLQISYVDPISGVRKLPQAATPVDFGQITAEKASLTFYLSNTDPNNFSPVAIPNISVTGAGFAIAGAPATPTNVPLGQSASFQLIFSPSGTGAYNGTLSIGTRQFSVTARGASSAIPDVNFQVDQSPLANQQQAHLSIQLASPSPITIIGTLAMQFTPSVSGISDDPAIKFLATNGRQLQMTAASGSQTATYNGQSSLTFQTGTTAGTLTFSLTFPNKTPMTKSFTIAPAAVQITSAKALRQDPNLVLNLIGYDNTYSIGNLNFTFYDSNGKVVVPNGISVDAASSFHQFFFNDNQAGGAFTLQAKFPVRGDITKISSVAVTMANSAGTATSKSDFQ